MQSQTRCSVLLWKQRQPWTYPSKSRSVCFFVGFFLYYFGCCRNLSVHIFLSWQPLALHVSLTFLFWWARWLSVFRSIEPEGPKLMLLVSFWPPGIYGLSNSLLDTPWKKLLQGKRHFTSVVNDQTLSCDGLVQELLGVLNNEDLWVHITSKQLYFSLKCL